MDNNLKLSKNLLENFLRPINRLTESCVLKLDKTRIYSVCSSSDNTVILYVNCGLKEEVKDQLRFNIINIKKFLSGLECLETSENGDINIQYHQNYIKCESSGNQNKTFFKYYLVDDSIVKEAPVNLEKIAKLKFDTEFTINLENIKKIMSGYAFATDVSKIYFYSDNSSVYAEINDQTLQNVDNITLKISNSFEGEPINNPLPVNIEIFKNLTLTKNGIKVKINNQYKVLIFQNLNNENIEAKYIVSALVK
jgi:hypothetical protein